MAVLTEKTRSPRGSIAKSVNVMGEDRPASFTSGHRSVCGPGFFHRAGQGSAIVISPVVHLHLQCPPAAPEHEAQRR